LPAPPDAAKRLAFALSKSDVVAKADGSWLPKEKRAAAGAALPRLTDICWLLTAAPARQPRARDEEQEEEDAGAPSGQPGSALADAGVPNKILFVQGLPASTTHVMLATLFQQFPGCAV